MEATFLDPLSLPMNGVELFILLEQRLTFHIKMNLLSSQSLSITLCSCDETLSFDIITVSL
jgi:hypothetical protein